MDCLAEEEEAACVAVGAEASAFVPPSMKRPSMWHALRQGSSDRAAGAQESPRPVEIERLYSFGSMI